MAKPKQSTVGKVSVLALAVMLSATMPQGAIADESNFNQDAYDSASQSGIDNANCNSALVLTCDAADPAPIGLPALLGPSAMAGLGVLLLSAASRRRRTG